MGFISLALGIAPAPAGASRKESIVWKYGRFTAKAEVSVRSVDYYVGQGILWLFAILGAIDLLTGGAIWK